MRIPNWLFLIGIAALVVATAVCSAGSFVFARRVAVDLGSSGVQVSSLGEVISFGLTLARGERLPVGENGSTSPLPFDAFLAAQPTLTPTLPEPTATPRPDDTPAPTETPGPPTATPDPLAAYQWNDPRRFNILLLGIDQRGDEQGPFRTDTMIVLSVDPVRKLVGMLSIPRDLWVPIPGFQPGRINTANSLGDANGYPGGGPALAARTVTENLGIEIDKYVRVNFDVFTTVVNLIAPNGVEVCPTEEIDDPDYPDAGYGTIHVHFDPGCQRLDAERLLQYARTRATEGADFDRAMRQQEVIKALRDEVLSAGGIANFIGQIPALWEELSGAYVTNLTLEEIFSLAVLAQDIPRENIRTGVINNLYVDLTTTPSGDQVLIPRYTAIRTLVQQVFSPPENLTLADLRERAEAENASIVVYNNTDISGLAGQTREWLASRGVAVEAVGNIPEPTGTTTIIRDYTGKVWTARYLAALFGLPPEAIQPGADGLTTADVMVVAGPDIQTLLSGQAPG